MSDAYRYRDDAELQAYIDGQLAAHSQARAHVEARLADDEALRDDVQAQLALNEALRTHFDAQLHEPAPARLQHTAMGTARGNGALHLRYAAAVVFALAIGGLGGWVLRDSSTRVAVEAPWIRSAAIAYATYAPEVRHPIEVGGDQQAHLVAWLSKRLGTELRVPDLREHRYQLVGGRLLSDDSGAAAMFMFENPGGQRLTLYVHRGARGQDTAFRFARDQRTSSFYWIDRGYGYALTGELSRDALQGIAESVYRQLNP